MSRPLMLDSGPLGRIAHPKPNTDFIEWLKGLLQRGEEFIVPEIADYEVRRSFLLNDLSISLKKLDALKHTMTYLPIDTDTMLKAAELWAQARKKGRSTADPQALDGDVILAAQALKINAVIITENIGHLDLFVDAKKWSDMR